MPWKQIYVYVNYVYIIIDWGIRAPHYRQLVSMSKPGSALTFTYDADGNRITKTVNGTTTTYTYADGRVTHETNGTDTLHYRYDTNGTLLSMNLNGTEYYYLYNGQRDVIGLYDANGNVVVEYTYDAWGKPLTTTGSLASTVGAKNPYRYRGYRYDMENERYCLRNRLYDPVLIRFTSSDQYVCTGIGIVGANMFAYCNNSPVSQLDPNGEIAITTVILIGSAVLGAISAGYTAYKEYKAGNSTGRIIGDSVCAGFAGFSVVYSGGMSLYQCYQNYCYLNALSPVTSIQPIYQVSFSRVRIQQIQKFQGLVMLREQKTRGLYSRSQRSTKQNFGNGSVVFEWRNRPIWHQRKHPLRCVAVQSEWHSYCRMGL